MKKILLPLLVLSVAAINAQQIRRCGSYEVMQRQMAADPAFQSKVAAFETSAAQMEQAHPNGYSPRAVVIIPVVFHVLYANNAENISNTRIYEQLQVLNDDYRKTNADAANIPAAWQPLAADCEILFCLAQQDPAGNWTNGIHRVSTTNTQFDMASENAKSTAAGGTDVWDSDRYLNIWVCDLEPGVLGYAQFPSGPASTDGVVIDFAYTGKTGAASPYNKGRTCTHEVGHWLGLSHIWGDDGTSCSGSDGVSDTPNQSSENYGCFPAGSIQTDACSPSSPGVMWCNYMDYTDDACMYFFTNGQKTRMWNALNGPRAALQSSTGCILAGVNDLSLTHLFSVYPSPSNGQVTLDFGDAAPSDYDVTVYNTLGEAVKSQHIEMLSEQTFQLDLRNHAAGIYFVEVRSKTDQATRRIVIE